MSFSRAAGFRRGVQNELEVERGERILGEERRDEPAHDGELRFPVVRTEFQHLLRDGELPVDAIVEEREEEVVLAREVGVDRALGEAGERGDIVETGTVEAVAREHHGRGFEEVPARQLPPPFGREGFERHFRPLRYSSACGILAGIQQTGRNLTVRA